MSEVLVKFGHSPTDGPAVLSLEIPKTLADNKVVRAVRKFVEDGYRNGTWVARDPPTEADLIQADLQYNALKNSGALQLQRDQSNFNAQIQENLRNSPQRSLHDL